MDLKAAILVVLVLLCGCAETIPEGYAKVCFEEGSCILAEKADTPDTKRVGLAKYDALPEGQGMIFLFDRPGRYGFWMKDMKFPIDIIWVGEDGRIAHIERSLPPCTPDACPLYTPEEQALYVVEVAANYTQENGIEEGSMVYFFV